MPLRHSTETTYNSTLYIMYTHTYYTHHTRTIAIDLLTIRKLKKWFSVTIKGENVA